MNQIRIIHHINNREIICKIMDSVAKTCDCRIKYDPQKDRLCFSGDQKNIKYIAEQTLAFFPPAPTMVGLR